MLSWNEGQLMNTSSTFTNKVGMYYSNTEFNGNFYVLWMEFIPKFEQKAAATEVSVSKNFR